MHGVSLTVNGVAGSRFHVNLIPHTLAVTTLGALQSDDLAVGTRRARSEEERVVELHAVDGDGQVGHVIPRAGQSSSCRRTEARRAVE